jgi:hypothetical protein
VEDKKSDAKTTASAPPPTATTTAGAAPVAPSPPLSAPAIAPTQGAIPLSTKEEIQQRAGRIAKLSHLFEDVLGKDAIKVSQVACN